MDVKELKKNQVANVAKELFADFGYKSVSMEQIAMRANVAKGTLYLYFKDKEDLFYYLAQQFITEMKNYVQSVEEKHLSLLDELHEIVYSLLMFRRSQKFIYKVKQEAKEFNTPAARHVEKMLDDTIMGYMEKRLQAAMDEGVVRKCNTEVLSFIVIRVYTALAFEWEETHEALNEEQIASAVRLFLKDGLITA